MKSKKCEIIEINSKTINLSYLLREEILDLRNLSKKIMESTKADIPQILKEFAEIISMICVKQDPEMTKDWFLNNIDIAKFLELMKIIFKHYARAPTCLKLITKAENQKHVGNGPKAELFDLVRKLEEAVLNALQSVFFRHASELSPVKENYKNAHKIALEDRNIQWIFACFRSKRRREELLVSVSDFFSYSVGGGCHACL